MAYAENPTESLTFPQDEDYRKTRDLFRATDFTESGITKLLKTDRIYIPKAIDSAAWMRRTASNSALDLLVRLIVIGAATKAEDLRALLGKDLMAAWQYAGLIAVREGEAHALLNIVPFHDLWISSDRPLTVVGGPRDNFVMGIGGSTRTLINATVRRPVRKTLDLGTGCGVLALLAAGHSQHVVAADLNPRAIDFVHFNAALNDIHNIEGRVGNLFEPMGGESFDLIVSNPPFVISPSDGPMYRDGGQKGDYFCERLFHLLPPYLSNGGFAHVLLNWIQPLGGDGAERLEKWFVGSGCDTWIMHSEEHDPAAYAAIWIHQTGYPDTAETAALFERWMRYYDEQRIEAIGMGLANLRKRPSTDNWFRILRTPEKMTGACGEDVVRYFEATDLLCNTRDRDFLHCRFVRAPDVQMDQSCAAVPGGWRVAKAELRRTRGLCFVGGGDPLIAAMLAVCNGTIPLGAVIETVCAEWEVDPREIAAGVVQSFRDLLERGFVYLAKGEIAETSFPEKRRSE